MSLLIPNTGRVALLDKMLKAALSVDETYTLRLYKTNVTLTAALVASDLNSQEADFTSYAPVALTRAGWGASAIVGGVASSTHGTTATWTCGTTGNTIYGYYITGTSSGTLLWAEAFAAPRVLAMADVLNLIPVFTFTTS